MKFLPCTAIAAGLALAPLSLMAADAAAKVGAQVQLDTGAVNAATQSAINAKAGAKSKTGAPGEALEAATEKGADQARTARDAGMARAAETKAAVKGKSAEAKTAGKNTVKAGGEATTKVVTQTTDAATGLVGGALGAVSVEADADLSTEVKTQ